MANIINSFQKLTSLEHLFQSWFIFRKGKRKREDVLVFERHLEKNIFNLRRKLLSKDYKHKPYHSFHIHDPKIRLIRKASVEDRLVHQAVYSVLSDIYDRKFIYHLYSSRIGKGTHKAVNALRKMTQKVSNNLSCPCFALKCDVKKFYDSVDHRILLRILSKNIQNQDTFCLLNEIICSYSVENTSDKGMPIGNVTSQIFTSIYLNELDQYVKHTLKAKNYIRFADDIIFLSQDKNYLKSLLPKIEYFLANKLALILHPKKIHFRSLTQGIDFLGYVTFPYHKTLRTVTKKRMKKKLDKRLDEYFSHRISEYSLSQTMQSYLGILSHANTLKLQERLKNTYSWK